MSDTIKSLPLILLLIKGNIGNDFEDKIIWLLAVLIYNNNFV